MSNERIEGKERKEHGKAEEKIGKEFDDTDRQMAGKEQKEFGKVEEKIGKEKENKGISSGPGYVCASCGASFVTYDERAEHNQQVHRM
jgi:uncharacterized protein YjbJ (UPF0337 family)